MAGYRYVWNAANYMKSAVDIKLALIWIFFLNALSHVDVYFVNGTYSVAISTTVQFLLGVGDGSSAGLVGMNAVKPCLTGLEISSIPMGLKSLILGPIMDFITPEVKRSSI